MGDDWNPNALIVCPYDEVHVVSVQRFQRHILKCRKNHPDKDTVTCPYNATHIILRENLISHIGSCPDQRAIDADIIQAQNDETGEVERLMGKIDLPERTWVSPAESEDWDLEASNYQEEKRIRNDMGDHVRDSPKNKNVQSTNPITWKGHHLHDREEISEVPNKGLDTYVRTAGRGFHVNKLGVPEKRGVGRGTVYNRR